MPLIIMVTTSFKSHTEINSFPPTIIPDAWLPQNYPDAWNYQNTDFPRWTLEHADHPRAARCPGVLLTSSLCAYGFARLRFPGRNLWFGLVLASIMLPPQVTLIPLYVLFQQLGWLDTFLPLIVPAWFGGGALNIFLMRQFFLQIPVELDEAAIIDGASHFTIWWRIYMPLSRPVLVTVALLSTLAIWNDFFGPLIYLTTPDNYTLALGLNLFQGLFVIAHRLHHGHLDPDGAAHDPAVRARPALHRAGVHLERPEGVGPHGSGSPSPRWAHA